MPKPVIAYYRVSTCRQGESGLGLDAQRQATKAYIEQQSLQLCAEFTEVESGRKRERPQLEAALSACRKRGAILLIAKLDRLARNVHFISGLLEADVKFVAIDMPSADRFMMHVYAAMAEEEARRISDRTRCALQAAKRRGVVLGKACGKLAKKNKEDADSFALRHGPNIEILATQHGSSIREISSQLNVEGLRSAKGGDWHPTTVARLLKRYQSIRPC